MERETKIWSKGVYTPVLTYPRALARSVMYRQHQTSGSTPHSGKYNLKVIKNSCENQRIKTVGFSHMTIPERNDTGYQRMSHRTRLILIQSFDWVIRSFDMF